MSDGEMQILSFFDAEFPNEELKTGIQMHIGIKSDFENTTRLRKQSVRDTTNCAYGCLSWKACEKQEGEIMPRNKKQGIALSLIMSLIMIYVMAALNLNVRAHAFLAESWVTALKRLPLGYVVGVLCDLCICTPLSRKIVGSVCVEADREIFKVFILRFCMVIFMTIAMTVFSVIVSGKPGAAGIADFFTYLPYNFTIAMPIQMLIVAPLSLRIARCIAPEHSS